ncbi:MAG TPA: hypothetical protein DEO86_20040 [Colwellia sp.]|nr:hypothetical protein [Colwellia sp.]|tara:strand:+ start:442 stop:912 length:471 start_codon:yes stop_codon:yes gene_type:complete
MLIKNIVTFAVLNLLVSTAHAEKIEFPKLGFSIDSLDSSPSQGMVQPIQMFLPAENGFSPNVNVQVQPYSGTIKQYRELSEGQFKQIGLKVLSIKEMNNSITLEYTGVMQGFNLHWYAKAFKKGNHIYLVTATSTKVGWEGDKEKLISNVDSFQIK